MAIAAEADIRSMMQTSFSSLGHALHHAIVYLDDGATDCIACSVGFAALLKMGAVNVHHLSHVSDRDAAVGAMLSSWELSTENRTPNVVVFLMQLLQEAFEDLVHLIQMHPMCDELLVFCTYSVDAHAQLQPQTSVQNIYTEFESRLTAEMRRVNRRDAAGIHIRFCPWMCSCLTSQAFVLQQSPTGPLSLGFHSDAMHERHGDRAQDVHALSHALVGLASHLGRKLDVFALGPDAQAVGSEVVRMDVPLGFREVHPEETAALVLVDRCFDLVAPLHRADTLMDRILDSIEAEETSFTNGITRLADLSMKLKTEMEGPGSSIPAFSVEPPDLSQLVAHLLGRTCRDGSLYIRKWIREEIRAAGLRSEYKPKAGAPCAEEFSSGVKLLQDSSNTAKRLAVRALALYTAKALDPDTGLRTNAEVLQSNEKQILSMPSSDDLVKYFPDLLLNAIKPSALLSFQDVCGLLAFAYSILHDQTDIPFNLTEEKWILEAFIQSVLDDPDPSVLHKLSPSADSKSASLLKMEVRSAMQERLDRIKSMAAMRKDLKELKRLSVPHTLEHRPLVQRIVSMILQDKSIHDLHHVTSTFQGLLEGAPGTGLLSKGLGRLGFARQQESGIGKHNMVILFVVGGISLHEVTSIAQEVEENGKGPWKPRILFGSNALLTPKQTVRRIWNL